MIYYNISSGFHRRATNSFHFAIVCSKCVRAATCRHSLQPVAICCRMLHTFSRESSWEGIAALLRRPVLTPSGSSQDRRVLGLPGVGLLRGLSRFPYVNSFSLCHCHYVPLKVQFAGGILTIRPIRKSTDHSVRSFVFVLFRNRTMRQCGVLVILDAFCRRNNPFDLRLFLLKCENGDFFYLNAKMVSNLSMPTWKER